VSFDERRPASAPREPPRWEQRLGAALPWYGFVFLGSVLLATGSLPIHLTAALQRLADIAVAAEFVLFLPAGFILIVGAMRRNPATSRSEAWGIRLLVTSAFGGGVLVAYGFSTSLLADWQRSNAENLVLALVGALMFFVLFSLGLVLELVALIGKIRHSVRSRYRHPLANSGA
jgi:hypothetical protein